MIKKKRINNKAILQKLNELEREAPSDKPFIAFINKLGNGIYEVIEHTGVGFSKGKKVKSVKYTKKIVANPQEYTASKTNLDYTVIIDDLGDEDEA